MLTVARCNVVDDWALVAVWPSVPCKLNGVSGVDVGVETSGCGTLVAVHVRCANGVRLDETVVLVQSIPACRLGTRVLGVVVPDRVGAVGVGSLHVDSLDEAVGGYGVEEDGDGAEKKRRCVHDRYCAEC